MGENTPFCGVKSTTIWLNFAKLVELRPKKRSNRVKSQELKMERGKPNIHTLYGVRANTFCQSTGRIESPASNIKAQIIVGESTSRTEFNVVRL